MRNFKRNEQDFYWFNLWLLTSDSGCAPWIAKAACEYLGMMTSLREMNE